MAWRSSCVEHGVGADGVDQPHERRDELDLAALQVADEVPGERVAVARRPSPAGPARGSRRRSRCRPRRARRGPRARRTCPATTSSTSSPSRPARAAAAAIRSRTSARFARTRSAVEAGDQLGHGALRARRRPPGGPVVPPSRRCEKNRPGGAHSVQSPTSWTSATPARSSWRRATSLRSALSPRRAARAVGGERRVHLGPGLVAAGAGAGPDRRVRSRPRAPSSRSARTPSASTPPASPRQPAWTIATALRARRARPGRQSAVSTTAATPSSAVAWPSASSSSAGGSGSSRTRRTWRRRGPGAPAAVRSRAMPVSAASRSRLAPTRRGVVVGQDAEVQRVVRRRGDAAAARREQRAPARQRAADVLADPCERLRETRRRRRQHPPAARRARASRPSALL